MEQARRGDVMKDVGILAVRAVGGALLAGHGAQKLFGVFGGPGLRGTAGVMEMLGLRPGPLWGTAAALSEFGGGTLLALGLLSPLGSIGAISAMTMATVKAHWGKPIWVTKGGAELAVTYGTIALAVGLTGPGTPTNAVPQQVVALAQASEQAGLDLVTFQDHPYQASFLDTWTLLSYVAAQTERIHVSGNVI